MDLLDYQVRLGITEDTSYICGICPGGVPLLKGSETDYDSTPHYYCPACKCNYTVDSLKAHEYLQEAQAVTKEEIEKRIIELKNLKDTEMTAPGRQAVEDAIMRLSKRLKGKEV